MGISLKSTNDKTNSKYSKYLVGENMKKTKVLKNKSRGTAIPSNEQYRFWKYISGRILQGIYFQKYISRILFLEIYILHPEIYFRKYISENIFLEIDLRK